MISNYKHEIVMAIAMIGLFLAFYYLYGILLPFIIGLILAFLAYPLILKIQKMVRNKDLATTIFLTTIVAIVILFFLFLTQYVNRDFKRLNHSFTVLVSDNKAQLDQAAQKAKMYVGNIYDFDELRSSIKLQADSLASELQILDYSKLDTEAIAAGFEKIVSVFQSEETGPPVRKSGFSFMAMLISSIVYFILILYQMDYFISVRRRYFSNKVASKLNIVLDDFNKTFVKYLKLRTKIVLILAMIYLTAFIFLDMPGLIIMIIIIILLSYIPYLQYLALIPLAVGCLVLSTEHSQSFLLYYGIVVGVFVLASVIEELLLNPKIMEKNIGINPVILILALSVWSYLFGIRGLIIGIPMTSLFILYFKRFVLTSYQEVFQDGKTDS